MILPNDKLSFLQEFMVILIVDVMLKNVLNAVRQCLYICSYRRTSLFVRDLTFSLFDLLQRFTKLTCVFNQEFLTLYSPQMNL